MNAVFETSDKRCRKSISEIIILTETNLNVAELFSSDIHFNSFTRSGVREKLEPWNELYPLVLRVGHTAGLW